MMVQRMCRSMLRLSYNDRCSHAPSCALSRASICAGRTVKSRSYIQERGIAASASALHSSVRPTSLEKRHNSTKSSSTGNMYTASTAFFEALWDAGVTHCFVNLGSDHPSLLEAIARGRKKPNFPQIITCPNEMVAMSMADGYARYTGKPQCVIVHVDVGTQGLGAAMHNASCGRAPILIFAGLSPVTLEGEYRGSRTEYIHWIQDVPDQKQIVAQYCRYTGEIKRGRNVKQMVNRALSFAMSEPRGPVYLYGDREAMEEDIDPYQLNQAFWKPVEPAALPQAGIEEISRALMEAKEPLIVTGYSGRNHECPSALVALADTVKGLRVLDTGGSDMCFPANHPGWLSLRYGNDPSIKTADFILVLDCDVPWVNTQCHPNKDCKIYHIDVDPLKQQMPTFYINALARYRADATTTIKQITAHIQDNPSLQASQEIQDQQVSERKESHQQKLAEIAELAKPSEDGYFDAAYLTSQLRKHCPEETIWVVEAVTSTVLVTDQIQATQPGTWINCGGGGLGWSGGAALGVKLAADGGLPNLKQNGGKFICQIVGDGTFLFSVPGSVYWIAQRYNIPVLTIVLNNEGWRAPKRSLLLVHPDGEASKASGEELGISFNPSPDYAGLAKAAAGGKLYAAQAGTVEELDKVLKEAIESVKGGVGAIIDAHLDGPSGKYQKPSGVEL